jgi:chromosome segregation ATPase
MESTQRNNTSSQDSSKPLKPMYRRSTSLPIPDCCAGQPKASAVALTITNNSCRGTSDARLNTVLVGNRLQQKQASCSTVRTEFLGFGAAPPRLNAKSKQCSQTALVRDNSQRSSELLKDAERLVQNILQNNTIRISQETLKKAIQQSSVLQSKKRYSSLLEKPWRMASKTLHENEEFSSSDVRAKTSTRAFRRSLSSDSVAPLSSIDELVHSKKALEQANERILSLQKDIEKCRPKKKSIDNPLSDDDDSLSSTNIDDEDEIAALATTASFISDTMYDAIQPPLDFVRAPSPEHRSRKTSIGSDNFVNRLEYRALQIRNEQLVQKISFLENQLSPDDICGLNDDVMGGSSPDVSSHESEKEAISDILCKLSHVDKSQQVNYMENKIAALIKQLQQSESKCQYLTDNEIVAKATIENLSTQLLECEQKAKEYNERLVVQAENRFKESNKDVLRMEQELNAAKEDVSLMKSAMLSAESKCLQLEQMHAKVVSSLQSQLNHSESKSQRLQDEMNSIMATAVEIVQVKAECELLQNKLRQAESRVLVLQSNEDAIKQMAVHDIQRKTEVRISQLEASLAAANTKNEIATQRLLNLELAQAKEQEILSEELRDSETTIACLMEDIAALKPLLTDIVALEKRLQDKQADYEMKETELAEATAALTRSEADVEELRNELGMLTSLPEIVRKMEKELKIAQSKLANIEESSFDVTDLATEQDDRVVTDHDQLLELREAYYMAEEEVTELKSQLDLLKPLASELENAEQELRETCVKLDTADREVEMLTNELDMMQTALADLNEAERELTETRTSLTSREQDLQQCRSSLTLREQELEQCRAEIILLHDQIKSLQLHSQQETLWERQAIEVGTSHTLSITVEELEAKVVALEQDLWTESERKAVADKTIADLVLQLSKEHALSSLLLAEIDALSKKLHMDKNTEHANNLVQQLQEQLNLKDEKILEVNSTVVEQKKLIDEAEVKVAEMEKQFVSNESKILELTSLVAKRDKSVDAANIKTTQLTVEYAALIADRDNLRKNLAILTSKVAELEMEVKQKDSMINEILLRHNDATMLESLQNENDRTLERCSDLSLQLAESQFKIDRLTEQLRSIQRKEVVLQQQQVSTSRPGASFQSLINTSIDRISSRLDDSLRNSNKGT